MNSEEIVTKIIEENQPIASPNMVYLTEAREPNEEHNSLDLTPKTKGKGFAITLDNLKKILSGDSKLKGAIQYNYIYL